MLKAQGLAHHAYFCYLEALKIQPTFAIAWSNLAGICMEWGDLPRALAYYEEAVRLKPKFADAHCNMGNVLKVRFLLRWTVLLPVMFFHHPFVLKFLTSALIL